MGDTENAEKPGWIDGRRRVDPLVQAYYDSLDATGRDDLHKQLTICGKKLADMRIASTTGKLDKRLLVPVGPPHPVKRGHDGRWVIDTEKILEEQERQEREKEAAREESGNKGRPGGDDKIGESFGINPNGGKLPQGKDLGAYIKDELGDGKLLADFYIGLLKKVGRDARKAGIFMNHKLEAAKWLGERGWGRVKDDGKEGGGIVLNIIDYSNANIPKAVNTIPEEARQDTLKRLIVDADVPKDKPVVTVLTDPLKETSPPIDIEVDEDPIR